MEEEMVGSRRVCVVGASGRTGSLLVKKLLERGHVVHATVRNLCDPEKTEHLKRLPGADAGRLLLFEADLFDPHKFELPIQGCHFVFLVAFPMRPKAGEAGESTLAALRGILGACERSGTVRRFIYTGSVATASPLGGDGLPYTDLLDESCWTRPDHVPIDYGHDFVKLYVSTKTASEKQLMRYAEEEEKPVVEVVILTTGQIGGEALVDKTGGVEQIISPLTGDAVCYQNLVFLQNLLCSVPLVHQDDVCEAHLFCMDVPLTCGATRLLCASAYPTLRHIIAYYQQSYPEHLLLAKALPEENRSGVTRFSTKLRELGFEYKYGMEQILDDSVRFAKKLGVLKAGQFASPHHNGSI